MNADSKTPELRGIKINENIMDLKDKIIDMAFNFENEDGTFKKPSIFLDALFEILENDKTNIMKLTQDEKQSIKVLNYIATFDGAIENEDDMKYILNEGIKKFIAPKRQYLVSITETAYPIRIKY